MRHKNHCGDKASKHCYCRCDKGNLDRFVVKERAYEHCDCACDHGYERCEYGVKEFGLHIAQVALELDVSKHDYHSYGKASYDADGVFFEVGEFVTPLEPNEKSDYDECRHDCYGKIECDVLQVVAQSLDIHKKSPPKLCLGELE